MAPRIAPLKAPLEALKLQNVGTWFWFLPTGSLEGLSLAPTLHLVTLLLYHKSTYFAFIGSCQPSKANKMRGRSDFSCVKLAIKLG